jgi:nucleotide-binding universal stress UspA family protein
MTATEHEEGRPSGRGTVVVGIDGSDRCRLALKWASDEARRRGSILKVLYAQLHPPEDPPAWYEPGDSEGSPGQAVVDDAVGLVATRHPSLTVRGEVVEWPAALALTSVSRDADLLVVGARGRGGFKELLLGSVGDQCVQYAHCPVAVVHDESEDPIYESAEPRLVVGIDGSPGSARALRWALDEARIRSAALEAVFAWHYPPLHAGPRGPTDKYRTAADQMVESARSWATGWEPDVPFHATTRADATVPALIEASRGAELLVVGSRRHVGFHDALSGSVAHQAVRHAMCPVVVVRPRIDEQAEEEQRANLWTGMVAASGRNDPSPAGADQ